MSSCFGTLCYLDRFADRSKVFKLWWVLSCSMLAHGFRLGVKVTKTLFGTLPRPTVRPGSKLGCHRMLPVGQIVSVQLSDMSLVVWYIFYSHWWWPRVICSINCLDAMTRQITWQWLKLCS